MANEDSQPKVDFDNTGVDTDTNRIEIIDGNVYLILTSEEIEGSEGGACGLSMVLTDNADPDLHTIALGMFNLLNTDHDILFEAGHEFREMLDGAGIDAS